MPSSAPNLHKPPLRELCAEPGYLARVSEAILAIADATDYGAALDTLHEATSRMGADVAAFLSFIRDDGRHASFRYLLDCDPQWCVDYEEQAWYDDDPWLAYARSHSDPARGRDIAVTTPVQHAVIRLAERYGFCSTVIVPVPSGGRLSRVGMLCLGSSTPGYFDDEGFRTFELIARPLANILQEWLTRRLRRELLSATNLSADDLLLLRHEVQSRGTKEIAGLLGVSEASINSRFQRLIAKLEVRNRKEAARLAAEYGLIWSPP